MSLITITPKINKNIFYRNNQTLQNDSKSLNNKLQSLPTISYHKIPKIKKLNFSPKLNLIKSQNAKKSFKNVLLSPISKKNSNIEQININKVDYITKIIIENPPSFDEVTFLLENYFKNNKCQSKYKSFIDYNIMILIFEEEKIALDCMKLLFQEKQTNPSYQSTSINLYISEKKNKIKFPGINNKIANEVLQRLYYGFGYEKKEKPVKKILGNIKFSIQSPFFNSNSRKMMKNVSELNSKEKNIFNKKFKENIRDNKIDVLGVEEKQNKYNKKLRMNFSNTNFKPALKVIIREEDKSKWMSPLDFKIY